MALASSVTITSPLGRQITWTFDTDYEVGQFVNGDWWVRENTAGGGVTVTSISPFSNVGGRVQSGTMLNPDPLTGGNGRQQGYDSTMYQGSFTAQYWNPALCENLSLPKMYLPGSSLCSTVSNPGASTVPQLYYSAVLTVVASIPDAAAFRPPYCTTANVADKLPQWTTGDVDWSKLVSTFDWDDLMEPERPYADVLDNVSGFVLDHARGFLSRFMMSAETGFGYGRDYTAELGNAILGIVSDLGTLQKQALAIQLIQKGIDSYFLLERGHYWPADGGHMAGRKFPILLAGHLLGESRMLDIGVNYVSDRDATPDNYFGEDGQTFIVEETSPGVYNYGHGGYTAADVGLADWGFRHYENSSQDRRAWDPAAGGDQYRMCCTANTWIAQAYACKALGLREAWNHEPFFEYMERFMDQMPDDPFTATVHPAWFRSWTPPHDDVWDAHYATLGDPTSPSLTDLGTVNLRNDSGFARTVMARTVVPALQGQLANTSTKIETGDGDYVAWTPLVTERGGAATWGDGSYKYALCWIPTTLAGNQTKSVSLRVNQLASEPTFALHSAVAAQLGTWLTGGSATGWGWTCDVAPGTVRSAERSIFTHGTVTTLFSNANVRRVKWFVRSEDGRYVWEHYFEFYRGVPYAAFWSNVVFSDDTITDLTDYLQEGVEVSSAGCYPNCLDPNKFFDPNDGNFGSWTRRWAGTGRVGDAQGLTPAEGLLAFIDPASPGGASAADIATSQAVLDIEETAVSARWRQAKSFGPFGYVPELPSQFTSASAAFDASMMDAAAAASAWNWFQTQHAAINRLPLIDEVMSSATPGGTGSQADHGISKWHQVTILGVPRWMTPMKICRSYEWGRAVYKYESGDVVGTTDGDIVSVDNHPNLAIWDCRPFVGDLLGKLTRFIGDNELRSSVYCYLDLNDAVRTTSFTAASFTHYKIRNTGSTITVEMPTASGASWIILDNETPYSVNVDPQPGQTINGSGVGVTLPAWESRVFTPTGGDPNQGIPHNAWEDSLAYRTFTGYDRQHHSINFITHHFLLSGDPISGRLIDHHRELLRGAMRDYTYVQGGGNFTIGTYEADRQVGRCSLAAAWIQSISPNGDFLAAINSYYNTSLSQVGLQASPQQQLWNDSGGAVGGFAKDWDLIQPGHELIGLETDISSINISANANVVNIRSWTPWQRGIMMAGMLAWHKVSGNARALELTRLLGNNAVEYLWFEDRQTANNGIGVAAGGYYNTYHALRFDSPGRIGNMPPPSQLPPAVQYNGGGGNSGGGRGPDLGNGIAAFRVWTAFLTWCWPCPMIARQIMIDDGIPDQALFDKANAIIRGFLDTYYAPFPAVGTNQWNGPADNDLDWTTAVEDPFSQNYTGTAAPTQYVDPTGVENTSEFGSAEAILTGVPQSGANGIIIVRGR